MSEQGIETGSPNKAFEPHACSNCGEQHIAPSEAGLEKMLSKLGMSDDVIGKMRTSLENLDFEAYFAQAKDYMSRNATTARDYAKENKKTVAAAVGAVALAAGVLIALKMRGDRNADDRDRV